MTRNAFRRVTSHVVVGLCALSVLIALVPLEQFLDRRQARTPPVDRAGTAVPPIERKKPG